MEDGLEEDDDEMEDEGENNWVGPFSIDLLNGTSDPEVDLAEVEAGLFTKIEAEFSPVLADGATMTINGTISDEGSEPIPFEYTYWQTEDLKIESDAGVMLDPGSISLLVVSFDLTQLFEGVDFNLAVVDEDGVIRINKDINRDLADIIETNFETATSFEEE